MLIGISKKFNIFKRHFVSACVYFSGLSILLSADAFLFHHSGHSFFSGLDIPTQVLHLAESVCLINYFFAFIFLILSAVCIVLIPERYFKNIYGKIISVMLAVFCALSFFILAEKMLYSFFRIGILESYSSRRAGFAASFIFLLYFSYAWIKIRYVRMLSDPHRIIKALSVFLVSISFCWGIISVILQQFPEHPGNSEYPNIILLSGDGIRAANVSVYGYERLTTPFLEFFKDEALVAEHAYSNNSKTPGSLVSVLTGMSPATTKVFDAGNNLSAAHSDKSLPALLKKIGYKTYLAQSRISPPLVWLDSSHRNMQNAFDYPDHLNRIYRRFSPILRYTLARDFVSNVAVKLMHLFYIRDGKNTFSAVSTPNTLDADRSALQQALKVIRMSEEPFFLQLHLIGPHGPLFETQSRKFSGDQMQYRAGQTDFYDDAIRDFDAHAEMIYDELTASEKKDRTVLVVFSDHGMAHNVAEKIPMMFRFPFKNHRGLLRGNAQLIDIAPTVLDYIGQDIPEWMDGDSLLNPNLNPDRTIFSFSLAETAEDSDPKLEYVRMIQCGIASEVNLIGKTFSSEFLYPNDPDCVSSQKDSAQYYNTLIDYLTRHKIGPESAELRKFEGYSKK